jgi:glycosyltransferase involved in cell wall biosynthesis
MMIISIITPCYNSSRFISRAIESVIVQACQSWEMIIIDDCSEDDSYKIALNYANKDERVKVYRMERNCGAAVCRNKAIGISRGDYLAFLDSDDIWMPEKLEKQLRFMQENNCDFSFAEYEYIDEDDNSLGIRARVVKKLTYRRMLFYCFPGCLTVMYKQDINNKVYGPNISNMEDYGLFLEVIKRCSNARGYSQCLAKYRIRHNSLSRNKFKKIFPYFRLMMRYEHINFFIVCIHVIIFFIFKSMWRSKKINLSQKDMDGCHYS